MLTDMHGNSYVEQERFTIGMCASARSADTHGENMKCCNVRLSALVDQRCMGLLLLRTVIAVCTSMVAQVQGLSRLRCSKQQRCKTHEPALQCLN